MTQEEIAAELAELQRLLRAREGKAGYGQNVVAIKARIEELKTLAPDPLPE